MSSIGRARHGDGAIVIYCNGDSGRNIHRSGRGQIDRTAREDCGHGDVMDRIKSQLRLTIACQRHPLTGSQDCPHHR